MLHQLFSKDRVKVQYERAKPYFEDCSFLHQHAYDELLDRFKDIKRSFSEPILMQTDTGSGDQFIESLCADQKITGLKTMTLGAQGMIQSDFETLPLNEATQECVIGHFIHHKVNDLPGNLAQIRHSLKPDGLFIAAMLGGETLYELRQAITHVESQMYQRQISRVHPFADKQQMGELMMRAGFALPVVDSDVLKVSYRDVYHLMHDVKGMGEGYALTQKPTPVSKQFFDAVDAYYKDNFKDTHDDGRIEASFEIIYLLGWAPDASQQKPARRGSGEVSLTQVLDTSSNESEA